MDLTERTRALFRRGNRPRKLLQPLSLTSWASRRDGSDLPLTPVDLDTESTVRLGVLVHLEQIHELAEIAGRLAVLPIPFDLIVTASVAVDRPDNAGPNLRRFVAHAVGTHGSTTGCISAVNHGLLDGYLLVLRLAPGARTHRLVGVRQNVIEILNSFAGDLRVGILAADGDLGEVDRAAMRGPTVELAKRLGIHPSEGRVWSPTSDSFWCRGIVLQGLRAAALDEHDLNALDLARWRTTIRALIGLVTAEAGLESIVLAWRSGQIDANGWVRYDGRPLSPRTRFLALYATSSPPWADLANARSWYLGQYQPRRSTDLGCYSNTDADTMREQGRLANFAGLDGFLYDVEWTPQSSTSVDLHLLKDPERAFPFAVLWEMNLAIKPMRESTDEQYRTRHLKEICAGFLEAVSDLLDARSYLRVDGRRLLAIGGLAHQVSFEQVVQVLSDGALARGLEPFYIMQVGNPRESAIEGPRQGMDSDGSADLPPHNLRWQSLPAGRIDPVPSFAGVGVDYLALVEESVIRAHLERDKDHYPGMLVDFDSTALAAEDGLFWYGANPYSLRRWAADLATGVADRDADRRIVLVNAWNDWVDGAVLEPTDRRGRSFMLAIRDVALS